MRASLLGPLVALALAPAPVAAEAPRLELDATVTWIETAPGFGGFSGLVVLDGGAGLTQPCAPLGQFSRTWK